MSKATNPTEFYVVGGLVQPDRPCYVERPADSALRASIRARHLTCVLGARGIGKSSLMHCVARRLRAAGELAAVVDLVQISVLAERRSGRGWGLAIAERIARELALDADVGPWWRASRKEERESLAEFLRHVVLANTSQPVTLFFDGLGATAAELPFLRDLLATIETCHGGRSSDPELERLACVLVGSTSLRLLAGDDRTSPWVEADVIELEDFSPAESYTLARGFGGQPEVAQALMDRVTVWTGGHPYLTQKVARSVLRKGGKLEDVEHVVHDQLLLPGVAESDPLLNHIRSWLTARAPGARRAAKLLRKLARGKRVTAPVDAVVQDRLRLSGVVAIDAQRRLMFRNRIFRELVGRWLKGVGLVWRLASAALVLLVLAAGAGYWYVQYLPTADIATLESGSASFATLDSAYQRLHALPGFAERADGLLADNLTRRSAQAEAVADVAAIDTRLRELPHQDEQADRLFAGFWLRRAAAASHAEQRDTALLYALRAAGLPAAPPAAGGTLAELAAADYVHLDRTLRLGVNPVAWRMQFGQSSLVALDAQGEMQRSPFGEAAGLGAAGSAPVRLTALQHVAVTRELAVAGDGTAGAFELKLELRHPAAEELLVTLTAPSGERASVALPHKDGDGTETFTFNAARGTPLESLADEGRRGVWRLGLVDRRTEHAGALEAWSLRFGNNSTRDEPAEPVAVPDPLRTDSVTVTAAGDWALVQPKTAGAMGALALWSFSTGRLQNDFALPAAPKYAAVNAAGDRLVAASERAVTLWNVTDGALVAQPGTDTEFVLPPVFSADGAYLAIAERVEDGRPLYSVLRAADGSLVGSFEGAADVRQWWLGAGARYLALQTGERSIRVIGGRRGETQGTIESPADIVRVAPLANDGGLLTVDAAGEITAWPVTDPATPRRLGVTASAASLSLAAGSSRLAYAAVDGAIVVEDTATDTEVLALRGFGAMPVVTQLSDDGMSLVTSAGSQLRLWRLPAAGRPRARVAAMPSAFALDRAGSSVALGRASGELVLDATGGAPAIEDSGQHSAVTALAVEVAHGVALSGGADGVVRISDLATGMARAVVAEPAPRAVELVALAPDGRFLAGAAGNLVRLGTVADGTVLVERSVGGAVTALAFSPDGATLAVGDAAGTLTLLPSGGGRVVTAELKSAITALAFSSTGAELLVGDADGTVRRVRAEDGGDLGARREFSHRVRWLGFDASGSTLLVATTDWLHALRAGNLEPLASRFAPRSLAGHAFAAGDGARVHVAEIAPDGMPVVTDMDLAAPPAASPSGAPRDWPAALGVRLDDAGQPAAFDP